MNFARAIGAVLATALLLAGLGGGIGFALGRAVPEYYRGAFEGGHDPRFDPASVGLGQGLTQGAAGGVVAGLALVALLCWRDRRAANAVPASGGGGASGRVLAVAVGLLVLIATSAAALLVGVLVGERDAYHRRYLDERDALAPAIASDPAFADVELEEQSSGGVYLTGDVRSSEELDRLRAAVARAVGERRAEQVLAGVGVAR